MQQPGGFLWAWSCCDTFLFNLIPSHISPCSISSHLTPSCPIPSHHLISSHLMSCFLNLFHLTSPHPISSHGFSPPLSSSQLFSVDLNFSSQLFSSLLFSSAHYLMIIRQINWLLLIDYKTSASPLLSKTLLTEHVSFTRPTPKNLGSP